VGRLTGDRITSSEIGHRNAAGVGGAAAITRGSGGRIRRLACCAATAASMASDRMRAVGWVGRGEERERVADLKNGGIDVGESTVKVKWRGWWWWC